MKERTMMKSTYFLCVTSLLISIGADVVSGRTLSTRTPGDVTTVESQSDGGLVLTRLNAAISILEDVDYTTNSSFNILCTTFCETYHPSNSCYHDISVAAKSFSDLSSLSSNTETPAEHLKELQTMCSVTSKYLIQVEQMVNETQRRRCIGSICPPSDTSCMTERTRNTKHCLLRLLSTRIDSFQLTLKQMIVANSLPVPTAASSESHDVITNPTIQDQRDLYILSNAHDTWIQMLSILRRILGHY